MGKDVAHKLIMISVQLLASTLRSVRGLKFEHRNVRDKRFQLLA